MSNLFRVFSFLIIFLFSFILLLILTLMSLNIIIGTDITILYFLNNF